MRAGRFIKRHARVRAKLKRMNEIQQVVNNAPEREGVTMGDTSGFYERDPYANGDAAELRSRAPRIIGFRP